MLRRTLLAIGALLSAAGVISVLAGNAPVAVWLFFTGAVLVLGIVYERWRYRDTLSRPEPHWRSTDERFIDPGTGRRLEVWFDPDTGTRHYVESSRR